MYILFGGADNEEAGGAKDIYGCYRRWSVALSNVEDLVKKYSVHGDSVWWHIYSVEDNCIVEKS